MDYTSETGELYDFEKDPYQMVNQINNPQYIDIKEKLIQLMDRYMQELDLVLYCRNNKKC